MITFFSLTKKVQTKVKKKWTKREMEGLLAAYERHKEDFITGVKLKIYGLIGEELEEAGILVKSNANTVYLYSYQNIHCIN